MALARAQNDPAYYPQLMVATAEILDQHGTGPEPTRAAREALIAGLDRIRQRVAKPC